MRLVDLAPEGLIPDMFIFKNPGGGNDWLTCKRIVMPIKQQRHIVWGNYEENPDVTTKWTGICVVLSVPGGAWNFAGNDFSNLTVTPSIDASKSGNWHGFITKGEIV